VGSTIKIPKYKAQINLKNQKHNIQNLLRILRFIFENFVFSCHLVSIKKAPMKAPFSN